MVVVFIYIFGPIFRPLGNYVDLIFFTSLGLIIFSFIKGRNIIPSYLIYFTPLIVLFFYGGFIASFKIDSNLQLYFKYVNSNEWIEWRKMKYEN